MDELIKDALRAKVTKYANQTMLNRIRNAETKYELFSIIAFLQIQHYLTKNNIVEPNELMKLNVHLRPDMIFELRV